MKKGCALLLACLLALTLVSCGNSSEEKSVATPEYPKSNITCVIPYGAGGTMDTLSRTLFECIPDGSLPSGVNFVVENIGGGGGLVGTEQALTKKPDGYTIAGVNGDLIINHAIGATEIVLEEDFVPLVCLQDEPYCLIGPAEGACSTLQGFVEKVRSGDNAVTVAITGLGSPGGLAAVALSADFGSQIKTVTYDASSDCALSVVSGECDATFAPVTVVAGQIEAGTLKCIAVTTAEPSQTLPGVPAIAQTYSECADLDLRSFCMLGALGDTDPAAVQYLSKLLNEAVASEKYAEMTKSMYMTPAVWTTEDMTAYCSTAYDFYVSILKQ